ncbi:MAG: amidase [Betaproteobacteria bacterium]|nr:amidase [Betaproteobacteria bacterium]MDH3436505.1 amidase [Betaproteobacteria bacterium]
MSELHFLSIAEAARLIKSRKLSPVELAQAHFDRIGKLDGQLSAFITLTADLALKQARQSEREIMKRKYRGPLHGIPIGLKDIYNTKGILTSGHSRVCIDNIPDRDAATVTKLYEAGAVLLGKLATHEFAHGGPSFDLPWPPARNPWNLEHFTGGSSSGSGAALATGLVMGAMGSDTGGSIRGPASHCGIVGLMPTYGLVSRAGVIPNSYTFDHCGPMTRTVEDCGLMLQALVGHDPEDAGSVPVKVPNYSAGLRRGIKGLKVGVVRHYWEKDLPAHEDVCHAMDAAIVVLRKLGAKVEDCHTRPMQDALDVKVIIAETEIFSIHYQDLVKRGGDFGRDILGRMLPACLFQAADYVAASREHRRMILEGRRLYDQYDVLLTAGLGPAPRLDAYRTPNFWQRSNIFTPSNVTAGPALELCNGFSKNGLPLGMQVIGRPFDEATVLRVGHAYQQATDWHLRRPQLTPGTPQPPVNAAANEPKPADMDLKARALILDTATRAGLKLNERQQAILLETAPYALAMADRIRKDRDRFEEPALVFRFPNW